MPRNVQSLLISVLSLWHDRSQKQLGVASGIPQKRVSQLLRGEEIEHDVFARLVAAASEHPAEAAIGTAFLESMAALEHNQDLAAAERAEVELGVQEGAALIRRVLTEAVIRSRSAPALDRYPQPADLEPARWHAGMLFQTLQTFPEDLQSSLVKVAQEYQSWAFVERLCEESVIEAARGARYPRRGADATCAGDLARPLDPVDPGRESNRSHVHPGALHVG